MNRSAVLTFSLLLTVICRGNLYSMCTLDQSFSLEEENFIVRYKCTGEYYSWYLSEFYDSEEKEGTADFSFRSDKIKAGRLEREGVWKELFNPFGYTADSGIYTGQTGIYSDFAKKKKGLYGISISLSEGFDVAFLLSPLLWTGADARIVEKDSSTLTFYALAAGRSYPGTEEWIGGFSELYVSKPAFAGGEAVLAGEKAAVRLAAFMSGNRYYRPDAFSRVYAAVPFGDFSLSALAVYAGRDYILPDGKPVHDRLLLSSSLGYEGEGGLSLRIRGTYRSGQITSYPSACTGQRGELFITGGWEARRLELNFTGSLKEETDNSCTYERRYNLETFVKTELYPVTLKLSAGESGEFEGTEKRWVKAETGIRRDRISVDLVYKLSKDVYGSCFVSAEAGGSAGIELPGGSINLSADFRACNPFGGIEPVLSGLSIDFTNRTVF